MTRIRNYTSTAPPSASVAKIEKRLIEHGVNSISKVYSSGRVTGLRFELTVKGGTAFTVQLPAKVQDVFLAMSKGKKMPYDSRRRQAVHNATLEQAERTAWKLLYEWVDLQLSMIAIGQARPAEVFLPYLWDGTGTLYDALEGGNFAALNQYQPKALPAAGGNP
jgi:hypothetical protein